MHTLCGRLEVVLLARHNWTGNKGSTLKALPSIQCTSLVSILFNLKLNPSTSLILKEHPELHATNSVSERSGGGGGGQNFTPCKS